ncbi:unnamed protein product [Oikopleura dioica]|uniref:Potassium channel domain-containing protein n=1 Tax=Oikopleura dioica TaxID=34765 RepID=E4YWG4_OIKDI|nr:unnamed protein product [Oikopleura dioica]
MGSASLKLGASFFVSVVILVLVGSWVLYTYESPAEIRRCEKAEGAFDSAAILGVDLTEELQEQTKMSDLTIMTNELFEEIKRQAQDVHQPLCENNWDYPNALFNTGTIIASLGFFHTAPQTFEGKLIVSSLVLFGTPLYFLSIGLIANAIAKAQLKKIVNTGTPLKIGGFTFGILVILALVTCVPASIIQLLEKIEFFDAWYFCVTTITTVGFGDIRLSGPAVAVWLLWIWIGHILMAGILVSLVSAIIISDYKTQQMRDPEEQKLLTQTDGPAAYG